MSRLGRGWLLSHTFTCSGLCWTRDSGRRPAFHRGLSSCRYTASLPKESWAAFPQYSARTSPSLFHRYSTPTCRWSQIAFARLHSLSNLTTALGGPRHLLLYLHFCDLWSQYGRHFGHPQRLWRPRWRKLLYQVSFFHALVCGSESSYPWAWETYLIFSRREVYDGF